MPITWNLLDFTQLLLNKHLRERNTRHVNPTNYVFFSNWVILFEKVMVYNEDAEAGGTTAPGGPLPPNSQNDDSASAPAPPTSLNLESASKRGAGPKKALGSRGKGDSAPIPKRGGAVSAGAAIGGKDAAVRGKGDKRERNGAGTAGNVGPGERSKVNPSLLLIINISIL